MEKKEAILGVLVIVVIVVLIMQSKLLYNLKEDVEGVLKDYEERYDFYEGYYMKNNLTKVIEDSFITYNKLLNAQDIVIKDLIEHRKYNGDSVQKAEMINRYLERIKRGDKE